MTDFVMSDYEIKRNYLEALNPSNQIKILADLNVTTKNEIINKLKSLGIYKKNNCPPRRKRKRAIIK